MKQVEPDSKTELERQMTTSIQDVFQDKRITNALAAIGIRDEGDLHMLCRDHYCSHAMLLRIPCIGRKSMTKIYSYLREKHPHLFEW